jgi:hypothetical protein
MMVTKCLPRGSFGVIWEWAGFDVSRDRAFRTTRPRRLIKSLNQSRGTDQILDEARSNMKRVTPQEALAEVQNQTSSSPVVLVDIRPAAQWEEMGSVDGAMVIERNILEWRFDPRSNARLPVANSFAGMGFWAFWLIAKAAQAKTAQGDTDMSNRYWVSRSRNIPAFNGSTEIAGMAAQ